MEEARRPDGRQTFIFGAFAMMNVQDCPRMHCCGSLISVYLHFDGERQKKTINAAKYQRSIAS
jgi:hypothetical protein